ncbi:ABC transporter ATP-binding protein [Streptomyces montanus]|uniref:ABC transporter ATP-binding protein n=1 Tax=Streptomyces montanus TaxID=2580423 RepID=A0A5R9FW41_9ACTN|nr:ABC transporter ATP-binding protein [Streptomyces montanus]TLS43715.1 ABC transporter ATP-binding protein [Streptomyces montanus]
MAATAEDSRVGYRDLFSLLLEKRTTVVWALTLTVLGTALGLLQPLMTMRLIDRVGTGESLVVPVLVLAGLFLAQACVEAMGQYLLDVAGEGVVLRLRKNLVNRLLLARIGAFDRQRVGDLLSRVGTDTTVLRDMVAGSFVQLVTVALTAVGTAGLMLWIDPVMFAVVIATIVAAAVVVAGVMAGIRGATEQSLAGVGTMTADLERALGNIRTVRACRAENRETERIGADAEEAYASGVRAARLGSLVGPMMEVAVNGSFLLVLLIGAVRVSNGDLTISALVAFLLYATYLVMPLAGLFSAVTLIQRGLGSLKRIQEALRLPVEATADAAEPPARGHGPLLELRDVSFSYGERQVLSGVSLQIPEHGYLAMVGRSGAGKTTVASLIERFYDPAHGAVLFRGVDVRKLEHRSYRRHVALVEQHTPLLYGSLRDNLTYAAPDAGEDAIREALRTVNLDSLVRGLPDGLDTEVGERGLRLSGGERQRVAIARALLAEPDLLLLDEPTSQLDTINEAELAEALLKVSERCSLLVIAHRLSTVRAARRIVVMDGGRVSSMGTHEELLAGDRTYRQLIESHLIQSEMSAQESQL